MSKLFKQLAIAVMTTAIAISGTATTTTTPLSKVTAQAATTAKQSITLKNVNGSTKKMITGETFTLKSNYTAGKLIFKSSNPEIASVSSRGKITAKKAGTSKITITLKANKKVKKTLNVKTYVPIEIRQKGIAKSVLSATSGLSQQISTNYKKSKLIFTSSNPEVATVDADGYIYFKGKGTAKIIATLKANEEVKCELLVVNKDNIRTIHSGLIKEEYKKETDKSDYQIYIEKDRYDNCINLAFQIKGVAPNFRPTGMAGEMCSIGYGQTFDARKTNY